MPLKTALLKKMIKSFNGKTPKIAPTAFVAETAVIIGDVEIGEHASIWYNAVLRADTAKITIGDYTNVQDNVTIHVDKGFPATIGAYTTIGHNAVVHGATVGNECLVGMNSVLLNGSQMGDGSLVGAGALMTEGRALPAGTMGKDIVKEWKELSPDARTSIKNNATEYAIKAEMFKNG